MRRNVFILPTPFGFLWVLTAIALYLLGSNYANNPALLMSFLLLGMFLLSIAPSYANLSGLRLEALPGDTGFAEQPLCFRLLLRSDRPRASLGIAWITDTETDAIRLGMPRGSCQCELWMTPQQRGRLRPGPVQLSSTYPLGLFRCWTYIQPAWEALVYPKPERCLIPSTATGHGPEAAEGTATVGVETLAGLRPHLPGEPLTRVSWKHVARGQGWYTKQFEETQKASLWLRFDRTPGQDQEHRLRHLCWQVLQCAQTQTPFGLVLGAQVFQPTVGTAHMKACLQALALFEGVDSP